MTLSKKSEQKKPRNWGWLVLFTSMGTLLCCALPILLVSLGMGAVVASLASNAPILITLSQNKFWMFLISAIVLLIVAYLLYRPGRTCPTDPALAKQCNSAYKWNQRFFWVSVMIWVMGFFMAYALPHFF